MEPLLALSLVTLSGETCLIEIPQSAKVADVRRAAIPSLGYRARSGQAILSMALVCMCVCLVLECA